MTGVEILSSEVIYNTFLPEWCGVIAVIVMMILIIPFAISATEGKTVGVIICATLFVVGIFVMAFSLSPNENSINHIEYKVTIDDSVSMNEFLDKYEIIDQEGKIYTVKERED